MTFTSLLFLLGFLPLAVLLYKPCSRTRLANLHILIISLLFYAWGSLYSLAVLVIVLLWNYFSAAEIYTSQAGRKKQVLIGCIAVNLVVLFMYKYLNVIIGSADSLFGWQIRQIGWIMPAGLSFYMFSCLSYVFDIYMGKEKPLNSLINFGVFAAFFGWVNMGPIAHYAKLKEQLTRHPVTSLKMQNGALLFLQGLFMKVMIADNMAAVFAALSGNTSWLGNLILGFSYFFQLYFDFAGYSRMARGVASMFGFDIPKNFNKPYTAVSVSDFWRRWHISLTSWFRDYIYIPLGGNRVSSSRWIGNIFAVWLLTGIWHGGPIHFMIWGLYQGALQILERRVWKGFIDHGPKGVLHAYVIVTQLIGWTLFFAPTTMAALGIIGRYFWIGASGLADPAAWFVAKESFFLFVLAIIGSSNLPMRLHLNLRRVFKGSYPLIQTIAMLVGFLICIALLVSATNQTFLYAAF